MALALLALVPGVALAQQPVDCGRLRQAIHASETDSGQRDDSGFSRAAQQQRYEIDRTRRYAAQIGCGQSGAGFFGNIQPAECDDIQDRMSRMQDNLDRLQERVSQPAPGDQAARQAALLARYNAACVGNPANLSQGDPSGVFAPDDGRSPADPSGAPDDLSNVPLNGAIMDGSGEPSRSAGRAICVRSCDGGYFPIAPKASTDQLDKLDDFCKASCPGTEAHLYTMRGDLTTAVAVDGTAYTALPAAFKFEKSFSQTCSCKPANVSWAEALAGAEKMLPSDDRHDVTVTAAMSEQMAKPQAAPASKGKTTKQTTAAIAADRRVLDEAQRATQAPTASHDSAGIAGMAQGERVLGRADGLRVTVAGPDGVTKRIRLIVP